MFLFHMVSFGRAVQCHACLAPRRPRQLLSPDAVDVQVVDGLAALHAVVHDQAVALGQALLLGDLVRNHHQVAEELEGGGKKT